MPSYYEYPSVAHVRKHGPSGYETYESYREWLRDEFTFRCAYCLIRENWAFLENVWELDHVLSQADNPDEILSYDNLIYTCKDCNGRKGKHPVPSPTEIAYAEHLKVDEEGNIEAIGDEGLGVILIEVFKLNSTTKTRKRRMVIDVIESVKIQNPELWAKLMGFPDKLPNLKNCRPPENTRPDGVKNCYYELRARNELPETY